MRFGFLLAALILAGTSLARAETTIRVGWCASTISAAAAPYAVAQKMGWYAERGVKVIVTPLPGSTDCVKEVATGDLPFSVPSIEPVLIIHPQGVKAKVFYTAYQSFGYGIAVPADSPIKDFADLKGKTIGVTSMASAGVIVARSQLSEAGIDPTTQARIVVAGEGAQTAALLRSKQVDALSQFDTQYAMVENAGQKLRMLPLGKMAAYPGNGFFALESTLKDRRQDAIAVARGFAMGEIFAMANPEAAIRILYEVYPQTKPTGKDEETAVRDDTKVLRARMAHWDLASGGVTKWGESNMANFNNYIDFLVKWKIVPQKVPADEVVTNDLVDDINASFDAKKVEAAAKAYKP
ncbi:MAG TPA: ABC transporter substrate-binding protein [Rhodopila sp.]|uniref:ABC transporter substrate-binding protein n=1 Tax=Rhodopila sp. TaxID=2480087 RepID=UPI002CC759B9|nr:ABC transporter substrate-binding protein [Rhodopila sp.]HVY15120.1 ABC transporter substrate-binding protein [Rhodopila sp.]